MHDDEVGAELEPSGFYHLRFCAPVCRMHCNAADNKAGFDEQGKEQEYEGG
jgi:hypothetical protein